MVSLTLGRRGAALRAVWRAPLDEQLERRLGRIADLGERIFAVVLLSGLALRIGASASVQPWNLAALLPEGLVVLFMVLRRRPLLVSTRPWDWLIGLAGTAGPMMVAPGGHPLAPGAVAGGLILTGFLVNLCGKLSLRRSFGLAAANRGVVQSGAYKYVRHPIYSGYLLGHLGFFLLNPTFWNLSVYLTVIALMVLRMRAEEAVLGRDPLYAAFMDRVRYRLAPFIY